MGKPIQTLIGFLLFITGIIAVVLSLVGVQLSFLVWMDDISRLFGFVMKLIMVISGVIIIVLAQTDWQKEKSQ